MEETPEAPTRQTLAATANRQLSSPFFSLLPPEVRRMIYAQLWRHHRLHPDARDQTEERCLKYHIIKHESGDGYTHTPCVISDQTAPDLRMQRLAAFPSNSQVWAERIESDWAIHWPCEEVRKRHATHHRPSRSSFMSTLLTCKLM